MNIADYVIARLKQLGVDTLFGVVGVPCAEVFAAAVRHGLRAVVNSSDLEAGYAADGYARLRGLGAVSVSYGVGTMSIVNAIAGAYVEKSPVVVVNGGPSALNSYNERRYGALFSHSTGRESSDLRVFGEVTAEAVRVDRASEAPSSIDRMLITAVTLSRPVYLEISKDLWYDEVPPPVGMLVAERLPTGAEKSLAALILERLAAAKSPVVLLGSEIQRYGLGAETAGLLAKLGIRWATTLLAKSVVAEQTPGFVGVYAGAMARPDVRKAVEEADLLLALGCVFSTGQTNLVRRSFSQTIHAVDGFVRNGDAAPVRADLATLLAELGAAAPTNESGTTTSRDDAEPCGSGALTHDDVFRGVDAILDESWVVITDTFLGMYPAADLAVVGTNAFLSNSIWASIGHSVAAAVGAGFATSRRPLVLCGDGGFQMTCTALSAMARYGQRSVVIIIDNSMYGIEQYLLDPQYFRDPAHPALPFAILNRWDYAALARSMGIHHVAVADTAEKFTAALAAACTWDAAGVIVAVMAERDLPSQLKART